MMKGLMGCCLNHETTLYCVRSKAQSMEAKMGVESLEDGLGKEACLVRASPGRAGEADGGAATSPLGQGKRD